MKTEPTFEQLMTMLHLELEASIVEDLEVRLKRIIKAEFERGRRDMLNAITAMGWDFEGAFLLKTSFINALEQQLEESQKQTEQEDKSTPVEEGQI